MRDVVVGQEDDAVPDLGVVGEAARCSWISFLPPSSAGCALPAMTSCTGRSGWSRSRLSRSGSRSISVSRLYDGTRRAKPMVSTSGSSASSTHVELGRRRCRACRLDLQQPAPGVVHEPLAQLPLDRPDVGRRRLVDRAARTSRPRRRRRSRRARSARSKTSRPTQVGACTPLVIDVIGTSASSNAGHRPWNISRLTWPCSCETPLARWASRKPITAMLKTVGSPPA